MAKYRETRKFRVHQAREISRALMALIHPPENMNELDTAEMLYDQSTTTAWKLRNWYEDQLLEWFEHVNRIMSNYDQIEPRISDVKRLVAGMSVQDVSRLFIDEYEKYGEVLQ